MSKVTRSTRRENSINRYEVYLSDVFVNIKSGNPIKAIQLARKHSVSNSAMAFAADLGYVDRSRNPTAWLPNKSPTRAMAEKLVEHVSSKIKAQSLANAGGFPATIPKSTKAIPNIVELAKEVNAIGHQMKSLNRKMDAILGDLGVAVGD